MAASSPISFGTDGWRAVIAEDYTFENVRALATALAVHLKSYRRLVRLVAPIAVPGFFFACRLIPRWDVATLVAGMGSALLVVWAATARQIAEDHPLVTFGGWSYGVYLLGLLDGWGRPS